MKEAAILLPFLTLIAVWMTRIENGAEAAQLNYTSADGSEILFKCKKDMFKDHTAGEGLIYANSRTADGASILHCAGKCFEDKVQPDPCASFTFDSGLSSGNCIFFSTTWTDPTELAPDVTKQYCYATTQ